MKQFNINDAKTHLSELVEDAAKGGAFVIAKSGKPMVTVIPFSPAHGAEKRIGFLKGHIAAPADFDQMGQGEIATLFEGLK
ncbi:MAG: type II toxin-antitoxin system prevent-host-death family antitoxin [Treponema sp.]|jgi:prevent-host-death family protein|nr:type II toxin-antitoxin system prevent-host-death family antitoxin [Treponema sp.]